MNTIAVLAGFAAGFVAWDHTLAEMKEGLSKIDRLEIRVNGWRRIRAVFGWLGWVGVDNPATVMVWYGLATGVTYALQLALADHATKIVNLQARESEGIIS